MSEGVVKKTMKSRGGLFGALAMWCHLDPQRERERERGGGGRERERSRHAHTDRHTHCTHIHIHTAHTHTHTHTHLALLHAALVQHMPQHRQQKRQRLARACLGNAKHVAAREGHGQRLRLDRRWGVVLEGLEDVEHTAGQARLVPRLDRLGHVFATRLDVLELKPQLGHLLVAHSRELGDLCVEAATKVCSTTTREEVEGSGGKY